MFWGLHVGIFVIWGPAVFVAQKRVSKLLTFLLVSTIMATAQKTPAPSAFPTADELNQMAARFAPAAAPLNVDLSGLSAAQAAAASQTTCDPHHT